MVFNYGPRGSGDSGFIEFDPGVGGGKFNPLTDLLVKFSGDNDYQALNSAGVENKYKFAQDATRKKWEVAFLASCEVQFNKNLKKCDIFLVGGGNQGATSNDSFWGANGGSGGKSITKKEITLISGSHTVTVGGNGNASSIDSYTTNSVEAENGASGGRRAQLNADDGVNWYVLTSSTGGDDGKLAFGGEDCLTFPGRKFGAGGGGGGASHDKNVYDNGSSGGATGGGSGGTSNKNGTANTGSGGGGSYGTAYSAGAGGSGIIILRSGF